MPTESLSGKRSQRWSSSMAGIHKLPVRRHFFKVMMGDFRTKLSLPLALRGQLKGEKAVVRSSKGLWHIKVGKCSKGLLCFEEGWGDFVKHHDINFEDFVVFEHKGNMFFDALVFDSSSCEKEFLISNNSANNKKKNKEKVNNLHTGESPLEAARSCSPKTPHFITTIEASNVADAGSYLHIPEEFAKSINLVRSSILILRNSSRKIWPVKLSAIRDSKCKAARVLMKKGWADFYVDNKLKEGDVCLFELDLSRKETSRALIMDVQIFPLLI